MDTVSNAIAFPKPKRKKKSDRKKLVDKLDALVTKILRSKYSACVQCGGVNALGTGHVFSRKSYITRWDIEEGGNCYLQCWPCNYRHVSDQYPYFNWYISMYGIDKFNELRVRFKQTVKYKDKDLEELYIKLVDYEKELGLL